MDEILQIEQTIINYDKKEYRKERTSRSMS